MQRFKTAIFWTILVSETGHIFCCALPAIVSVLSILSGLGLMGALPAGMLAFHDFMHEWEIPVIIASAVLLVLGWGLHALSLRIDCHNTGCRHGACAPKKISTSKLLWIATALFAANITIYAVFHYEPTAIEITHQHHDHHDH